MPKEWTGCKRRGYGFINKEGIPNNADTEVFLMDFEQANILADRISRGENGKLYEDLVLHCLGYLINLKKHLQFQLKE